MRRPPPLGPEVVLHTIGDCSEPNSTSSRRWPPTTPPRRAADGFLSKSRRKNGKYRFENAQKINALLLYGYPPLPVMSRVLLPLCPNPGVCFFPRRQSACRSPARDHVVESYLVPHPGNRVSGVRQHNEVGLVQHLGQLCHQREACRVGPPHLLAQPI